MQMHTSTESDWFESNQLITTWIVHYNREEVYNWILIINVREFISWENQTLHNSGQSKFITATTTAAANFN